MPGLVPGIHAPGTKCPGARLETHTHKQTEKYVDGRDKPSHDGEVSQK